MNGSDNRSNTIPFSNFVDTLINIIINIKVQVQRTPTPNIIAQPIRQKPSAFSLFVPPGAPRACKRSRDEEQNPEEAEAVEIRHSLFAPPLAPRACKRPRDDEEQNFEETAAAILRTIRS